MSSEHIVDFSYLFRIVKKNDDLIVLLDCIKNNTQFVPQKVKQELIPRFGKYIEPVHNETYNPWAIMLAIRLNKMDKTLGHKIMVEHWPGMINNHNYSDDEYYFRHYDITSSMIDIINRRYAKKYTQVTCYMPGYIDEKLYSVFGLYNPTGKISYWEVIRNADINAEDVMKMFLNYRIVQKLAKRNDPNFLDIVYDTYDSEKHSHSQVIHVFVVLIYSIIVSDYIRFQKAIEFMIANIREIKKVNSEAIDIRYYLLDLFDNLVYHCPEHTCKIIAFINDHFIYVGNWDMTLFEEILSRGSEMFLVPVAHIYNLRPLYPYLSKPTVKLFKSVSRKYDMKKNKGHRDIKMICTE